MPKQSLKKSSWLKIKFKADDAEPKISSSLLALVSFVQTWCLNSTFMNNSSDLEVGLVILREMDWCILPLAQWHRRDPEQD